MAFTLTRPTSRKGFAIRKPAWVGPLTKEARKEVSLIIDDLKSIRPWQPRGIKIHGIAEVVQRNGRLGPGSYLAITPMVSWS